VLYTTHPMSIKIPRIKNPVLPLFITVFVAIVIGCASRSNMTVEKQQIPPNFGSFEGTLIVQSQTKSWNRYFKKHFDAYYSGKYIFVDPTEVYSEKYADTVEYKYLLSRNLGGNTGTEMECLYIQDRITWESYKTGGTAFFGQLILSYAKALEEARKNAGNPQALSKN